MHDYYKKLGKHLAILIDEKYPSRRKFGAEYLRLRDGEEFVTEENKNKMSHVISEIIKGNRGIQIEQIQYFAKLLNVTYGQLLDTEYCGSGLNDRATNYSISLSNDQEEWEKYIQREDKLILNDDEYGKTVLDYAISNGNYNLIKYLIDKGYISFIGEGDRFIPFYPSVSIERRKVVVPKLSDEISQGKQLRDNLIEFAKKNNDLELLRKMKADEKTI